jgi:hypothetical protein
MSEDLIDLLESCFEPAAQRPADAAVLVDRLQAALIEGELDNDSENLPEVPRPRWGRILLAGGLGLLFLMVVCGVALVNLPGATRTTVTEAPPPPINPDLLGHWDGPAAWKQVVFLLDGGLVITADNRFLRRGTYRFEQNRLIWDLGRDGVVTWTFQQRNAHELLLSNPIEGDVKLVRFGFGKGM